ncbi:MAG: GtrA family protein [Paludibacter sp.]
MQMGTNEVKIIRIITKLLKDKSGNNYIQMVRYFFAGGIAFIADTSVLYLLTEFAGFNYLISSIIGFSTGLIITYLMSIGWIFDQKRLKNKTFEFSVFVLIGVVGLALTSLFMWLFTSIWLLHYILSKIITTAIVFIWNFIAKKRILFTKKSII